ncbi:hypothetical protein F4820DRAFT_381345 [Hypoxylon rubiginosum]|uniref:Uncharacterized protein n=1 Tax=Hypoxylon rubiginosum TaxID=110542 RepID=A0ACB9YUS1_9PEZI|nr:hypothetical protein F4820DRAFT_381345 [Hypoxylon rubiginosum]
MVSIKSALVSAFATLPLLSSAYITSMSAPNTAKAGTTITTTLTAAIYVQNWDDFGIIWGLVPPTWNCGDIICVGRRIAYTPLFPDHEPEPGNFTIDLDIPGDFSAGTYNLVAAIPYLVGASGMTSIQNLTFPIEITAA